MLKEIIIDVYNRECQYCGQKCEPKELEVEHIVPRSREGSDDLTNKALACKRCNHKKMALVLPEPGMSLLLARAEMMAAIIRRQIDKRNLTRRKPLTEEEKQSRREKREAEKKEWSQHWFNDHLACPIEIDECRICKKEKLCLWLFVEGPGSQIVTVDYNYESCSKYDDTIYLSKGETHGIHICPACIKKVNRSKLRITGCRLYLGSKPVDMKWNYLEYFLGRDFGGFDITLLRNIPEYPFKRNKAWKNFQPSAIRLVRNGV